MCVYLTTREAVWYIISVVSVCLTVCLSVRQTITFESLNVEVHICMSGVSPGNTGQVRI